VQSMQRCSNGHFYDPSRNASCPQCARMGQGAGPTRPVTPSPGGAGPPGASGQGSRPDPGPSPSRGAGPTIPVGGGSRPAPAAGTKPPGGGSAPAKPDAGAGRGSHGATIALWPQELGNDPIVGWLVGWEGKAKGRDFRLRTGRLSVGRADNQQVQIDDPHVSREGHAYIVFEPKTCTFWLEPGDARGLVYIMKKDSPGDPRLVMTPEQLSAYDLIEMGETKLIFVPFCEPGGFAWQNKADEKKKGTPTEGEVW